MKSNEPNRTPEQVPIEHDFIREPAGVVPAVRNEARESSAFVVLSNESAVCRRQIRVERKKYVSKILRLVIGWLVAIMAMLFLQGFCLISLSDAVLISVAITSTVSVTAILVFVARTLLPQGKAHDRLPPYD